MPQYAQLYFDESIQINQKINNLKKLLQRNRNVQQSLKSIKNATKLKLSSLQQKMRNEKIYLERPIMKNIIGYITLMRKIPNALKDQLMRKNMTSKDSEVINHLSTKTNEKRSIKSIKSTLSKGALTNPKQIDFIQLAELESQFYRNGLQRYRKWKQDNYVSSQKIPFSTNQQSLLIEKYRIYRDNWDKICNFFDGRTFQELYYQFQYYSNKEFKKGRWTLTQNIKLIILVQYFGQKKWAAISKRIKDKSQIQVRQRFCNILDPKISKNQWSDFQIQKLLELALIQEYNWSKIAKNSIFVNKTDNIIWRKFRSIMIQKSDEEIYEHVKDGALIKILVKMKQDKQKAKEKNK